MKLSTMVLTSLAVLFLVLSLLTFFLQPIEKKIVPCYDRSGNLIIGVNCQQIGPDESTLVLPLGLFFLALIMAVMAILTNEGGLYEIHKRTHKEARAPY